MSESDKESKRDNSECCRKKIKDAKEVRETENEIYSLREDFLLVYIY